MDLTKDRWQSNHCGSNSGYFIKLYIIFSPSEQIKKCDLLFINFKGPIRQSIKAHRIPGIY